MLKHLSILIMISASWPITSLAQVETFTLFDDLHPNDVDLTIYCPVQGAGSGGDSWQFCSYDKDGWASVEYYFYYGPDAGNFELGPLNNGQDRPWVKMRSYHYTSATCDNGDTNLGGGWCKKTLSSPTWSYASRLEDNSIYTPDGIAGTYIDASYKRLDNIVIDTLANNMEVDFDPWSENNEIRPKSSGLIALQIKSTSIAAGDAYDFDATTIDPSTLKVGPKNALLASIPLSGDRDGDGDTDITFAFQLVDTGISCLDSSIMIAGMTWGGSPLAGHDVIVPIDCEEVVEIDLDPFNDPNIVHPDDNYNMTIALLGMRINDGDAINFYPQSETGSFGLNRNTVRIGPAETTIVGTPIVTDINGDSFADLLINFSVFDAGIACEDTELMISGELTTGLPLEGVDSIVTEDCSTGCHP